MRPVQRYRWSTGGILKSFRYACTLAEPPEIPLPRIQPKPGTDMRVLYIGAGNINFGSEEGPWNHSQRLEQILGARLNVVGVVDPMTARAESVLEAKRLTVARPAYQRTTVFPTIQEAAKALSSSPPHIVIVGSPPAFRGQMQQPNNAEEQLSTAFPSAGMFVEKPVSTGAVEQATMVGKFLESRKENIVSVGYMLRYSAAVQKMQQIIKDNGLTVMMTSGRYVMAYEASRKLAWWNKAVDCGPIVEQATHFVDLSRYFGGEIDLPSIAAHSIEWYERPGQLSKIRVDESKIPEDQRIPRFTSATWKYDKGAIGHLEHGVALQGQTFSTEFTVFADGYQMKLIDPYNRPTLYLRQPGSDTEQIMTFHDDDPFLSEMASFIDTVEGVEPKIPILSSYEDAVRTYEATWSIRWASEKTRRGR
ncbi:putative oxidoreductase C terminal-domain-containing protein [Kockovaella imperatae]|uniref:Putative oxidoreductase C terminal-domain-containing protein n=1 Tax=Kockovaella imperatae TaxID=4999 RepID=A0A1Y1UC85_9TREE|nr:putative oxidoreductase C terminal-domain-containing protein [Kockovaella imperatae]ORX35106.1 putative oxidoreductase C terminal-domain-containing protein [Kockovaella imperatae]